MQHRTEATITSSGNARAGLGCAAARGGIGEAYDCKRHFGYDVAMVAIQTVAFAGAMLQRGFWLYVWRVVPGDGRELLYVGRTGDNSSPNATAPYTRMGQHLGYVSTQNALRSHLERRGVRPEDCAEFELIAYGPMYPEVGDDGSDRDALMRRHVPLRNNTGAMEKLLCDELRAAGYEVMNEVRWRYRLDDDGEEKWRIVRAAFRAELERRKRAGVDGNGSQASETGE